MPQSKSPLPLYLQCIIRVNALILNACRTIDRNCNAYDFVLCESVVSRIQSYLLSNIPGHVLDDLCHNVLNIGIVPKKSRAQWNHLKDVDSRILLSVYLHKNTRKFSVRIRLPNDDAFWIKKLFDLRKVVRLDLKMVCTDEILEAVGNNCGLLEEVNILSKSECYKGTDPWNAMKLKYFVSDQGLKHLCKCKNLKKIEMNRVLKTQCAGRIMSHNGIKELVKSLPKLQYLSYSDVGMIVDMLVDEVNQLQLTHIYDFHARSSHIRSFNKLCPNLQELYLRQPVNKTEQMNTADIIQALTDSKLKLSALQLTSFPVNKHFESFLKLKGVFLTSLYISSTESISSDELIIIGSLCPYLENIHLTKLTFSLSDSQNRKLANDSAMFSSLKLLALTGSGWSPHIILPICLKYSLELTHINLLNDGYSDIIDDLLNEIMLVNPLKKLRHVNFFSGCYITFKTIAKLVSSCANLKFLSTRKHPALEVLRVANLVGDMMNRNMDIELILPG